MPEPRDRLGLCGADRGPSPGLWSLSMDRRGVAAFPWPCPKPAVLAGAVVIVGSTRVPGGDLGPLDLINAGGCGGRPACRPRKGREKVHKGPWFTPMIAVLTAHCLGAALRQHLSVK